MPDNRVDSLFASDYAKAMASGEAMHPFQRMYYNLWLASKLGADYGPVYPVNETIAAWQRRAEHLTDQWRSM